MSRYWRAVVLAIGIGGLVNSIDPSEDPSTTGSRAIFALAIAYFITPKDTE